MIAGYFVCICCRTEPQKTQSCTKVDNRLQRAGGALTSEAAGGVLVLPQRPHTLGTVSLHLQQEVTVGMSSVLQREQKIQLLEV